MIDSTLVVRHGHCAECGAECDELMVLLLRPDAPPRLAPKPADTHAGLCEICWLWVYHALGNALLPQPA